MSTVKLHYFDAYARGDVLRLMLHYADISFEDEKYTFQKWAKVKQSGDFEFEQMPMLEIDDKKLVHGRAIANYIASKKGWLPETPEEIYLDSWYWDTIFDLYDKVYTEILFGPTEEEQAKAKKRFLDEMLPVFLPTLEKSLIESGAKTSGYLVGNKLTP
eukprot:CAMPEP_0115038586 /NCGR_PEP_ID=MMETSP0216-20121206/43498_1 /TAXON_ID=223996 /ORGANISM="Protocruzia adherens, Strain Boccale" /LENGTH=158 /DNA_ID=CAMNT_0002419017 /DNA_START=135 /DNA_END=608 /DNA_ORIENTATION=-